MRIIQLKMQVMEQQENDEKWLRGLAIIFLLVYFIFIYFKFMFF
jgi:hypothetical protein